MLPASPPQRHGASIPAVVAWTVPVLSVGVALWLTHALDVHLEQMWLANFYAAVIVSTAVAGLLPGALAVVLSLVAFETMLFGGLATGGVGGVLFRNAIFVFGAGGCVLLIARFQRARDRAEQRAREIEARAREVEARAHELQAQVIETEQQAEVLSRLGQRLEAQTELARREAEQAELLQRLTSRLMERAGPAGTGHVIVEESKRLLGAYAAAVGMRRADEEFDFIAADGYPEEMLTSANAMRHEGTPIASALQGTAVWISDRHQFADEYPDFASLPLPRSQAWVALPLIVERRIVGMLGLSFDTPQTFPPHRRRFMEQVAQQCAQALERSRLYELELRARVRAEFAERRVTFLANASAQLGAALDEQSIMDRLTTLLVPELADWCMIHVADRTGPVLRGLRHMDPARIELWRDLDRRFGTAPGAETSTMRAFRTGEPQMVDNVTDEALRRAAQNEDHYELMRSFGVSSLLAVPIIAQEAVAAVMTLAVAESGRTFTDRDVTLATELSRRAGQAIENARLYRAAQLASASKSDFLAVMSHELRTPLNAIIGYSDLLLLGVPDPMPDRARVQVQRIRSASDSLLALVDEVLTFSRMEAGREDVRISPVNLGGLITDCLTMIEPMAAEKHLKLEYREPAEKVKLISDELKIRQIVTNLLSNALKFTESGSVTTRVYCTEEEAVVEVEDTGIGIREEHLEQIFEPFWQVEQSATRRFGGTGLGLGVARRLAHLLGGSLQVRSTHGAGSMFRLALPLRMPGLQAPR